MKTEHQSCLSNSKSILTALSLSLALSIFIAPNARAEDAAAKAKPPAASILSKNEEAVFIRARKVVAAQLNKKVENIKLATRFKEDLGADSLDFVELVMAMEEEFNTSISDADAERLRTVKDIVVYISKKTTTSSKSPTAAKPPGNRVKKEK